MQPRHALLLTTLLVTTHAVAQDRPGDAEFCRRYAATSAAVAEAAIAINPACLDPGRGVHADRPSHARWCARTPAQEVEGAATHIQRLASRCTKGALAEPSDYGGFHIAGGNERFEKPYAIVRQWEVRAASSGGTFMYCVAVLRKDDRNVRIGHDADFQENGQWQLAVPVTSRKEWEGTLEVDGSRRNAQGTSLSGWTIAWLHGEDVDRLRNGSNAIVGVGRSDYDFSLQGAAAAMLKVQECRARKGAGSAVAAAPMPSNLLGTGAQRSLNCPERVRTSAATLTDPAQLPGFSQVIGGATSSQAFLQDVVLRTGSPDATTSAKGKAQGRQRITWTFDGADEVFVSCIYEGGISLTRPVGRPKSCVASILNSRDPGGEGGWGLTHASLRCS